ncbi:predicted protein [Lichtheimia corymbifera JMRC:FSU:9682]|uniref:Uncharacterized protein n=1 Tax=Lichtheimia corymbifera JMRC:FSU:9682 TaxID=1263082 RepID=A0A068S162_9FUNG|nr:predicted protein [Lichtheimia corymbifera JMRC:FSU:9682]
MDAIKGNDEILLWRLGSLPAGTEDDDNGSDGIDKGCRTAMDDMGALDSMHAAAILQSWMKDVYDGSNQEFLSQYSLLPSIRFTRMLFNLQCPSFIIST